MKYYKENKNMTKENECELTKEISTGWLCPKCESINAPWKSTCDVCSKEYKHTKGGLKRIDE